MIKPGRVLSVRIGSLYMEVSIKQRVGPRQPLPASVVVEAVVPINSEETAHIREEVPMLAWEAMDPRIRKQLVRDICRNLLCQRLDEGFEAALHKLEEEQ